MRGTLSVFKVCDRRLLDMPAAANWDSTITEPTVGHAVERVDDVLYLGALGNAAEVAVVAGRTGVGRLVEDELSELCPALDSVKEVVG